MNLGLMRCAAGMQETCEQRRIRLAQMQTEGHRVDDFDRGNHVEHGRPVRERGVRQMGGVGLVHLSEKLNTGSWRVERCAIVKADALAKFESVGETVGTDRPGSRQAGFWLRGAVFEAHEALADVDEDLDRFAVVHVGGSSFWESAPRAKVRVPARVGGTLATGECECQREKDKPFHRGMVTDGLRDGKQAGLTRMTGGLKLVRIFTGLPLKYHI